MSENRTLNPGLACDFLGELLGTFILVFLGCGSVAVAVLFSAHSGLFQVAAVWGMGVALAIYASRGLSCAHLNPAVSIAFALAKRMPAKKLPVYLAAQFLGAFLAAAVLYVLFSGSIVRFELANDVVRGFPGSERTAMMFGEYFPNPAFGQAGASVSFFNAFLAEGIGTCLLVLFIFSLTERCNVGHPDSGLAPLFIGAAVSVVVCTIAPLTQAGLNPARDFGPRLFAYLAGWDHVAIPGPRGGFLAVYVIAPLVGGSVASVFFTKVLRPLMERRSGRCGGSEIC
ncbi:MAG: aquaporin family protein [Elusimicrobia bacterium]|nr:aquaporin family protein [Elusimicrobiota bacterium]